MTTYIPVRCLAFLVLSGSFVRVSAQQVTTSPSSQSSPAASYQDNSEKLRKLLDKMLLAAKKDDRGQLQSMIQETEIPESWFATTFGEEKGKNWAEAYEERLGENEKTFEETMVRLAHTEGEFLVVRGGARRKYDLRKIALDGYRADYSTVPQVGNKGNVEKIGDFFFNEGKFLWDSTVAYFPAPTAAGNEKVGPVAANQRTLPKCSSMPLARYTREALAAKIQGSILAEGTIGIDGRITDIRVTRGLGYGLDEAAAETLKNWECSPVIGPNGKPVPAKIAFEINFQPY